MILDTTSRTLEIVLGEAAAAFSCDIVACYAVTSGSAFTVAMSQAASAGTAAVTVVPAPDIGGQCQVNEVRLHNNDTVTHRVTLRLNDAGTVRIIMAQTIGAGGDFLYTPTTVSVSAAGASAGALLPLVNGDMPIGFVTDPSGVPVYAPQ